MKMMHVEGEGVKDVCLTFYYKNGKRADKNYIIFIKKKVLNPVAKLIVPEWVI